MIPIFAEVPYWVHKLPCLERINPTQEIGRDKLKILNSTPVQTPQGVVRSRVGMPYCVTRSGNDVYPVVWDNRIALLVRYQSGAFRGVDVLFEGRQYV